MQIWVTYVPLLENLPNALAIATFPKIATKGTTTIPDPNSLIISIKINVSVSLLILNCGKATVGNPDWTFAGNTTKLYAYYYINYLVLGEVNFCDLPVKENGFILCISSTKAITAQLITTIAFLDTDRNHMNTLNFWLSSSSFFFSPLIGGDPSFLICCKWKMMLLISRSRN